MDLLSRDSCLTTNWWECLWTYPALPVLLKQLHRCPLRLLRLAKLALQRGPLRANLRQLPLQLGLRRVHL